MSMFEKLGIKVPEILLPDTEKTSLEQWSVIACDQFTSNRDYWEDVKTLTGGKPSTLDLIFPECYLKEIPLEEKINSINKNMNNFLDNRVLRKEGKGFVLVERETPFTPSRQGLLIAVDLEKYDYSEKSDSLIRPTEKTVIDRLPPRIKIRENASLDLPHILFLIDDEKGAVIEKLYEKREKFRKLYDFKLMKNGGKVRGWMIDGKDELDSLALAFEGLSRKNSTLFAVGDGNHSLAAAKEVWNIIKKREGTAPDHPARYALVEVVNIRSSGLGFEPIHRVVFDTDPEKLLEAFMAETGCETQSISEGEAQTPAEAEKIVYASGGKYGEITLRKEENLLAAEKLQAFLDRYTAADSAEIDYIHGEKDLLALARKDGNIGFLLPVISKETFFPRIAAKGVYPRKTFSIGESLEKRYYLESRIINPDKG